MHLRNGLRKIHDSFIYVVTQRAFELSYHRGAFLQKKRILSRKIVSARMWRDDGGEETEEPQDSFHVGSQSVRET